MIDQKQKEPTMKDGGKRDVSGLVGRTLRRNRIRADMISQLRSDARAEGWLSLQRILTNIKARPTTCPSEDPGSITTPLLHTFQSSQAQIWLFPPANRLQSRVTRVNITTTTTKKPGTKSLHFKRNHLFLIAQESKPRAPNLPNPNICPLTEG